MENPESRIANQHILKEISAALFDLRDAFVELSLALKDWQFEADLAQRKNAAESTAALLKKVASPRNPSS